ncbi:hypothetical protein SAMN05444166_5538 [Singulisphaera sp. GP187]|uniref:hypothetical protein n=1 Tax=Singulisphaera sp. GP187 TaxID=1882752 RepID=UPI00092B06D1|nr:hypothetical protein [Singulisphaera sp. GP187]SIO57985.1 hypothetical protein SAMN05444166_5538 [Singulisphaera sp. GP187]
MAFPERFQFGFAYHRVGMTRLWRPSGSTLRRVDPDHLWTGSEIVLALKTDHIIWIDVLVEEQAGQDINDLSQACESAADAEFRRLFPDVDLAEPPKTAYE